MQVSQGVVTNLIHVLMLEKYCFVTFCPLKILVDDNYLLAGRVWIFRIHVLCLVENHLPLCTFLRTVFQ